MAVTIKEILEKYPVLIDINKMKDNLLNFTIPDISIDDIEKPVEFEDNGLIGILYKTNGDIVVSVSEGGVSYIWKDEYGSIHSTYLDLNGEIINT